MKKAIKAIDKKINHVIGALIFNGIFLVILAILILYLDKLLEIIIALALVTTASAFIYLAYKIRSIRKNIDKFDINHNMKNKFKNKQITWARFWSVLVMERFSEKL